MNYKIHDLISIQLKGSNKRLIKKFDKNFKLFKTSDNTLPDIKFMISKNIPKNEDCTIVKGDYCVNTNYILCNSKQKIAKWSLEIKDIEKDTEVVFNGNCFSEIFFEDYVLEPLMGFHLLKKGILFLHASAFSINQNGLVFIGAPGTGKTSILLSFFSEFEDFRFFSDEISIISVNGDLYSFPVPIRIFKYNSKLISNLGVLNSLKLNLSFLLNIFSIKKIKLPLFLDVEQTFPKIGNTGYLKYLFLLKESKGDTVKLNEISKDKFVQKVMKINKQQFKYFSNILSAYSVIEKDFVSNYLKLFEKTLFKLLDDLDYYEIEIPPNYDHGTFLELNEIFKGLDIFNE